MILEADLPLLVLKRGNLFDENSDGVQYFGNITYYMITYKFLRGFLLRMRDRCADGVFHSAILAPLKTRQTPPAPHQYPPRLPAAKSKNDFYNNRPVGITAA